MKKVWKNERVNALLRNEKNERAYDGKEMKQPGIYIQIGMRDSMWCGCELKKQERMIIHGNTKSFL